LIDFEGDDGKVSKITIGQAIDRLVNLNIKRAVKPIHAVFPEFIKYNYWPGDWRQTRNLKVFRAALQKMIDERRLSKSKDENDLLTILTTTEFFAGDDNLIIDEIITFFLAGMKTI
jgi:cytochrome P450